MFKRFRRVVLVVLALAVVSGFTFVSQASAANYTNACRNSAVGTNWDQINVSLNGASPSSVTPGGSVTLSAINQTIAVPGAIFVAGYNLGLLTVGPNTIPATVHDVIDASNTVQ